MRDRLIIASAFAVILIGYFYEHLSSTDSIGLAMLQALLSFVRAQLARPAQRAYLDRVLMREARARAISRLG